MSYLRKLTLALILPFIAPSAYALDAACTTTTNLGMARCPEDSTDWYESYTDQIDELDALAKTAKSSFTVQGAFEATSASIGNSGTQMVMSSVGNLTLPTNADIELVGSSGRIGIGRTPTTALDVIGVITSTSNATNVPIAIGTAFSSVIISFSSSTAGKPSSGLRFGLSDQQFVWQTGPGASAMYFNPNTVQLGIGEANPVGTLNINSATGVGQVTIDGTTTGGCIMLRDTDDAGWTECDALDGTLSCSVDADGICD